MSGLVVRGVFRDQLDGGVGNVVFEADFWQVGLGARTQMSGRAWTFMTLKTGRQYAGNHGYADVLSRVYRYDSHVSSSRQVSEGDLVFVRDKHRLVGLAIISRIQSMTGTKVMRRCPRCGITGIKERRNKKPRFRCDRGHPFRRPKESRVKVKKFAAHFGNSFIAVPEGIAVSELKAGALRPSDQKSIEEVNPTRLRRTITALSPAAGRLLARFLRKRHSGHQAENTGGHSYWIVSPTIHSSDRHLDAWRRTCVSARAAFIGRGPGDDIRGRIGAKFAGRPPDGIGQGDVILIARPHQGGPTMVGFGVVHGKALTRLKSVKAPEAFRSMRRLRPFRAWSRSPPDVPFKRVLRRWSALTKLNPAQSSAHRQICRWLSRQLQANSKDAESSHGNRGGGRGRSGGRGQSDAITVTSTANAQLDYTVRSKPRVIKAKAIESRLVERYRVWLAKQSRKLQSVTYGSLRCDAYEAGRRNLIEAKSSARTEHIRMAVGQLMHYEFRGQRKFGELHKAILVPTAPDPGDVEWLESIGIAVIWPEKGAFADNAGGQFT